MTDPRKSVAIAKETGEFGSGQVEKVDNKDYYYQLPPGTWFSHTEEYSSESIYATGSKKRESAAYGPFKGSWRLTSVMDFEHTEILDLIFDEHTVTPDGVKDGKTTYLHTWKKLNNKRVKAFVVREKQLNVIAGGPADQVMISKGCIPKKLRFVRSATDSKMDVEFTGDYADEEVQLASLSMTDYSDYSSQIGPTQYSCMYLDSTESDDYYVRDVDSHEIEIDVDATLNYNTCSPISSSFFEGQTHVVWSAKTFANNPQKKFLLRHFSGGKDATHNKPMAKNLAPMAKAYFVTYNLSYRDVDGIDTITDAISQSPYMMEFCLIDSTVRGASYPDGNGEKITDSLQSVETTELQIKIRNTNPNTSWSHPIFKDKADEGTGPAYDIIPLTGVYGRFRPSITTSDTDILRGNETEFTVNMAPDTYVTVKSTDWSMTKLYFTFDESDAISLTEDQLSSLRGWFVVPFTTTGTSSDNDSITLASLFTGASDARPTGVTISTNILKVQSPVTDGGNPVSSSYLPSISFSGTPATASAGTYKYYIMKGDISPERVLTITDRGILRVDINEATPSS